MFKKIFGFGLVAVMLLACLAGISTAAVSYAKTYTDLPGDVQMVQNDDIDILEVKSVESGENVVITIKVAGTALTNVTYVIELNVDGEEASISVALGIVVYSKGEDYAFPNMTASGNTITFKTAKSDIGATTIFDIVSVDVVDYDYNIDSVEGGEAPVTDDDTTPTDDDTTPTDDDTTPTDDDVDDDIVIGDDDIGGEYEDSKDPKTETATDTSIGVDIGDFTFDYKETTTTVEMTMKLKGKTTGTVDHCALAMVTYYDDGTHDEVEWAVGDFELNFFGQYYFKGTGSGGKTDWSTWEYYVKVVGDKGNDTDDDNDTKKIKSIVFYVRAFSDEAQTKWGQDSKDVTGAIKAKAPEYADSEFVDEPAKKKSPGFELLFAFAALAVAGVVFWIRRK